PPGTNRSNLVLSHQCVSWLRWLFFRHNSPASYGMQPYSHVTGTKEPLGIFCRHLRDCEMIPLIPSSELGKDHLPGGDTAHNCSHQSSDKKMPYRLAYRPISQIKMWNFQLFLQHHNCLHATLLYHDYNGLHL
ncbi:hypothetical protein H671_1g3612, partial [Cricetulus griseus]